MGRVDLHTHSAFSDGLLSPTELVREAGRRGIDVLALTDHDTIAGLVDAEVAAANAGIELIPGVELSTDIGPRGVHLLGYDVDCTNSDLVAGLASLERQRRERIDQIVDRLDEIDRPVSRARVREIAGPGTIGRPHVARAMIERGYVATVAEAFDRYLAAGRPGFVPRRKNAPEDALALIRRAGGVPVLAHPMSVGDVEAVVDRLVAVGLLGLEVYYGEYDRTVWEALRAVADRRHLIATGGSDFHGEGLGHGRELGGPPVPVASVALLRAAARRVRAAENQDPLSLPAP